MDLRRLYHIFIPPRKAPSLPLSRCAEVSLTLVARVRDVESQERRRVKRHFLRFHQPDCERLLLVQCVPPLLFLSRPMISSHAVENYDNFCLFCHIDSSTKRKDDFAFWIFFTFKGEYQIIFEFGVSTG